MVELELQTTEKMHNCNYYNKLIIHSYDIKHSKYTRNSWFMIVCTPVHVFIKCNSLYITQDTFRIDLNNYSFRLNLLHSVFLIYVPYNETFINIYACILTHL